MKTLQELYSADQTLCANFLDSLNLQVSIKLHGISLQVYFNEETQKYEYHTHTDDLMIGPKISKLTKMFSKDITDAITYIEEQQSTVNGYRFLNFIIYDKEIYLISAMKKNETVIIDDYANIIDIANSLKVKSPLIIFKGRLEKDMQNQIINHLAFPTPIDSNEFKNKFKAIFEGNDAFPYETWEKLEYLEGLIFSVNFGDKLAKYKINDNQYSQLKKQKLAAAKLDKEQHKADYELLVRCMNDWLVPKAERLSDSHIQSLQLNFCKMLKSPKILMKMITVASKLPVRKNSNFMLQIEMLIEDIQNLIRKHGTPMRTLIEQFLLTYYKKRDWDYEEETKENINKVIDII